jgi:hypothetical protein
MGLDSCGPGLDATEAYYKQGTEPYKMEFFGLTEYPVLK